MMNLVGGNSLKSKNCSLQLIFSSVHEYKLSFWEDINICQFHIGNIIFSIIFTSGEMANLFIIPVSYSISRHGLNIPDRFSTSSHRTSHLLAADWNPNPAGNYVQSIAQCKNLDFRWRHLGKLQAQILAPMCQKGEIKKRKKKRADGAWRRELAEWDSEI